MPENLIQVFVSCPGDVTPEKNIIHDVVKSINGTLIREKSKFRFEVLDFRDIYAALDGRPQEEINITFSDYDIYFGMLWMRFGTPSGASNPITGEDYGSGTEEEFWQAHQHLKDGKNIGIYFFFKNFIKTKSKQEEEQYNKVLDFKSVVQKLGWVNSITSDVQFSNATYQILNNWLRKTENRERSAERTEFIEETIKDKETVDIKTLINGLPEFQEGIPRTLTSFNDKKSNEAHFYKIAQSNTLTELVKLHRHLVVLGGAGAGKSRELANLARHFSTEGSDLIPIYGRLNTYVDQKLEDFLPEGWQEVPHTLALVVLDGLDEIQPIHFSTAVRQILNFTKKFPEIRMVISCRTNFYDFPDDTNGGTLPAFNVFILDDLSDAKIEQFASVQVQNNGNKFFREATLNGFSELIRQPFFLQILLKQFAYKGHLDIDRVELFNTFIEERMDFDETHFRLTHDLKEKRTEIMQLLKKVALTMEYMGKNYILRKDLNKLLPKADDVKLIKRSTTFKNFENEPNKWGFEHNNIQEFLAASALNELDLEQIKGFISFDGKIIKPTWINTIFFLISILKSETREALVQWILAIDPDTLVKVEPDKVDPATRKQIFTKIFQHYKQQGVWLTSNKFTTRELAKFAPVADVLEYLIPEIENPENARIVKLNAVRIIKHLELEPEQSEKVKTVLFDYVSAQKDDSYVFYMVSEALANLGITDLELVSKLMDIFGRDLNQYIRAGFYQLILQGQLQNDFIDYLIEGVIIQEEAIGRDKIHFWDEDHLLRSVFEQPLAYPALQKVLEKLKTASDFELYAFRDKHDVTKGIISSAIQQHGQHPEVMDNMLTIYHHSTKIHEDVFTEIILDFFEQTGTALALFKDAFQQTSLGAYERGQLFRRLLSKEAVDYLLNEYEERNLTKKDLLEFYDNALWFAKQHKPEETTYMTEQFEQKTTLLQNRPEVVNYQQLRQEKEQQNIDLYFSKEALKAEVLRFFEQKNTEVADWDMVWKDRRYNYDPSEIQDAAHDLLVSFTRGKAQVSIQRINDFFGETKEVENLSFARLRDKLTQNSELSLSSDQLKQLGQWANDRSQHNDITQGFREPSPGRYSHNKLIGNLWHYISKFDLKIDGQKLLDFTTYSEPGSRDELTLDFQTIEKQTGKAKLADRVIFNLKKANLSDGPWLNNTYYAIDHQLKAAYSLILKDLGNGKRSEYSRRKVLKRYVEKTKDKNGLIKALKIIGRDNLRWKIILHLLNDLYPAPKVEPILVKILRTETESLQDRYLASKYLTQMGNTEGIEFFMAAIMQEKGELPIDHYHDGSYLRFIKDPIFIPKLIEMLAYANQPALKVDDFNRLDNAVAEALLNMGAQSEEIMLKVKGALEQFIDEQTGKIEHVNFYHPMIERMVFNYYVGQTRNITIEEAIAEIRKLE